MRHSITALALALLLLACAGQDGAWQRWGISQSGPAVGPEQERSAAYRLLYDQQFDRALSAYQSLVDEHPQSAEAWLGLSMAQRYTGNGTQAVGSCRRSLELDPNSVGALLNHADLLAAQRGITLPESLSSEERQRRADSLFEAATASSHPMSAYAHTGLWISRVLARDLAGARHQLAELGRKHYFPPLLVEFARNLLTGLAPDAVLFTNGDNDTYPLVTIQEHEGFRPDVCVTNLSLLNLADYAGLLRDSLGLLLPLDDAAVAAVKPVRDSATGRVLTPSSFLVKAIVEECLRQGRPAYFSVTVSQDQIDPYQGRLVLEGMALRVTASEAPNPVDLARLDENLNRRFTYDAVNSTDPWSENLSPITRPVAGLLVNYAAGYLAYAKACKARREDDRARQGFREALRLLEPSGAKEYTDAVIWQWGQLYPDDPEPKRLKERRSN